MRRLRASAPLLLLAVLPLAADAQPRLLVGGGFSAPTGAVADVADAGYHAQVGLEVTIPTLPVAMRADGAFHKLGAANATLADTDFVAGTLGLVFRLPGVGMQPYILAGIGSYRTESGLAGSTVTRTDSGYHGGFGVAIGEPGISWFAEIRYVKINGDARARLIPLTLGLRL